MCIRDSGTGGAGKTMGDLFGPTKRMKGSGREIIDPLESIIKNTFSIINLVDRNRVGQALVEQADKTEGSGRYVEKVPASMIPTSFHVKEIKKNLSDAGVDVGALSKEDMEAVVTVFRPEVRGSQRENILTVIRDGKREAYQVDPELYRSMMSMDAESSSCLLYTSPSPRDRTRSRMPSSA